MDAFEKVFSRCCSEYNALHLAVAWCGNPNQTLPYKYIEGFKGKITATVGMSFNHTHPDAIVWFQSLGADLRIFRDDDLFHPKVYLFTRGKDYAVLVGSSNLTYGGFYTNIEVNSLIEGRWSDSAGADVRRLQDQLAQWRSQKASFRPGTQWLAKYRLDYARTARAARKHGIRTPPRFEQDIGTASWLRNADWRLYYSKVVDGLADHKRGAEGYHDVLDVAAKELPTPWQTSYFKDIERRRVIGGMFPYGWLGHVAASGAVRHLLKNGTPAEWSTIVSAINDIAQMNRPLDWPKLASSLRRLTAIGPTMKVWGRLLCLVRPDLYCTVASTSVRQNLSKTLSVPQNRFDSPDGYIQLIKLIHASPWINSQRPSRLGESRIWRRRAAFLDAVFY